MSGCEAILGLLPDYGEERLSLPDRRAVRDHLIECDACRSEASRFDPTLLFAAVPSESVGRDDIEAVLAGVRAGIVLKRAERRASGASGPEAPRSGPRVLRVAGAAAALLMGAFVFRVRSPEPPPAVAASAVRSEGAAPAASAVAGPHDAGGDAQKATVYDLSTGAGEPRVVWIVDGSLDI